MIPQLCPVCVISDFFFRCQRLRVNCDEFELAANICDFVTYFKVILSRGSFRRSGYERRSSNLKVSGERWRKNEKIAKGCFFTVTRELGQWRSGNANSNRKKNKANSRALWRQWIDCTVVILILKNKLCRPQRYSEHQEWEVLTSGFRPRLKNICNF